MQDSKNRHLGTMAQLCWAISSQLRHVLTIGKNLLNSNTFPTCPDNMVHELPTTNGWDRFWILWHPCKFQRVLRLGSVTALHSSSGRQPKFAALNRGRHLHSEGRPSRWTLSHILVLWCSIFEFRVIVCFCSVRFSSFSTSQKIGRDWKNVSEMTYFVSSGM